MNRLVLSFFLVFFLKDTCFSTEKLQCVYNGELTHTIKIKTEKETDYFSLKDLSRACSASLSWYRISEKVIFKLNNRRLCFFYNDRKATVDNKKISLDEPTISISNDVYVPLSFLLSKIFPETFELKVELNKKTNLLELEKIINVLPARIYAEENLAKIVIELTEHLPYRLEKKSNKQYIIRLIHGKTDPDKIKLEDSILKQIESKNSSRQCIYKITVSKKDVRVTEKYQIKPPKLIFEIIPLKTTVKTKKEIKKVALHPKAVKSTETTTKISELIKPTKKVETATKITEVAKLIETAPVKKIKKKCIVLDPGHGGKDPGAIGPNGTKEKDINLSIAKEISKLLKEDKEYEVILTRTDDKFIPLIDRTVLANEKNADLFVSIHCNASLKRTSGGYEIYFLSEKASDPSAAATAALENSVIKLEGKPTKKRIKLQQVLWSMVVTEFMNESSEVCSMVTREVIKRIKIENRGIKQAGFYVLRGAQMPAILVEFAFISNPCEEAKLRTSKFQKQTADSVYMGIKKYFKRKESKLETVSH